MPIDLSPFRSQFPALSLTHRGNPMIFFDNPGGTQVPEQVIQYTSDYLRRSVANTHGAFPTSHRTDAVIDECHAGLAALLGGEPEEIVLGANMTSLTFAISRSLAREWQAGDEIMVTRLDHDANVSPWVLAAQDRGVTVQYVDVDVEDCTLVMSDFERLLSPKTKLVAVGWASNAVGTINPVHKIVSMAHDVGSLCYVDAVQSVPHIPCDVKALDADFLACSAYKFFGPHVGVLWGKRQHLEQLHAYKVRPAPESLPSRWETGTQNFEGQAAINGALEYLGGLGIGYMEHYDEFISDLYGQRASLLSAMHAIADYERDLGQHLLTGLQAINGVTIYGITEPERSHERVPTVTFRKHGIHPRQIAENLGHEGIAVWDGHYYALNIAERLGVADDGGMVRVGLAHYNTRQEVDRLLNLVEAM